LVERASLDMSASCVVLSLQHNGHSYIIDSYLDNRGFDINFRLVDSLTIRTERASCYSGRC
jgi:hypothetical protein